MKSDYYQYTHKLPLASRVSLQVRQKIFAAFMNVMQPQEDTRILDLGVTGDASQPESNFFERWYPHKDQLVCVGTEEVEDHEQKYPGMKFVRVAPMQPLPFPAGHFDIVFSNAVVEHAGSRQQQQYFIQEALRVSKAFFLSTPNRWFPVEVHTGLPLLHYLPIPLHRHILRILGYDYYALEDHLNLLDTKGLLQLFPSSVTAGIFKIRFFGFTSNLVVYGSSVKELA